MNSAAAQNDSRIIWAFAVLCAMCWMVNPTAWIADDSYFYLVIARNMAWHDSITFSGITPTNGFHPLWGWILGVWAKFLSLLFPKALLSAAAFTVVSIGAILLYISIYLRLSAMLSLSPLTAVIPAAFAGYFGVLASEGHLSLLALTLLCWQAINAIRRSTVGNLILCGSFGAVAVFSRLDNLFVAGSILVFVLWSAWPKVRFMSLLPLIVLMLLLSAYVFCNSYWYGGFMPISGWMKSSFPHVFIQGFHGGGNPSVAGIPLIWGWGMMVLATSMCIGARGQSKVLLISLLLGLIAKNAYIAFFTRSHTGWYWYSVLDLFVFSFALSIWAADCSRRLHVLRSCVLGMVLICSVGMIVKALTWSMPEHDRPNRGLSLVQNNTKKGDVILVSDWPGYVAFYAEDRHIIAADMLTSNRNWYEEMKRSENGIEFIKEQCQMMNMPLTHVLWNGNTWLVVSADGRAITFNDPRVYPVESAIGALSLNDDPIASFGDSKLWRL